MEFENYEPQAAIVNFYNTSTSLCAHQDDAEFFDAPLFSLSIGNSAVFQVGESKEKDPLSILIKSGDCVVMSGKSRLAYHGVPVVLKDSSPFCSLQDHEFPQVDPFLIDYLRNNRINLNVRQVLPPGNRDISIFLENK